MAGSVIGLFIVDFKMMVLVLLFIPIKCVVIKFCQEAKTNIDS